MTDHEEKQAIGSCTKQAFGNQPGSMEERPYRYRHAGIEEREGHIPLWLMLVVAGLLLWSVYYTIQFWSQG